VSGAHFEPMKRSLRERGLIGSDDRLTEAGHAHARALIDDLRSAEAPCNPSAPRVRWNHTSQQRRH